MQGDLEGKVSIFAAGFKIQSHDVVCDFFFFFGRFCFDDVVRKI